MHRKTRSQALQDCIERCKDCHDVCVDTAEHCLRLGGQHAAATHMRLLLDCVQVCTTSEDFMLRSSQFQASQCDVCADVCDACAAACAAFQGDPQMEACAAACRSCADACRRMVASQPSRSFQVSP